MLKTDFHIHATAYNAFPTVDHTVKNVIAESRALGLDYVGVLEHLNTSPKHPTSCLERLVADFMALELPENYFVGVEADINADGSDSCGREERLRLRLDYVIGSVHLSPKHFDKVEDYITEEFRCVSLALKRNENIDIIGHPWVQGIRWERNGAIPRWSFDMVPEEYQCRIIELASVHGKALEINNLPDVIEKDEGYRMFLKKLLESDVKVSVGSDAHRMDYMAKSLSRTEMLEELGFDDELIWIPLRPSPAAGRNAAVA